jgi:photosystem II stability/assembly factor-like uncharacterized protein
MQCSINAVVRRTAGPLQLSSRLPLVAAAATAALTLAACGDDGGGDSESAGAPIEHVHGLGINPGDGTLFIATHTGLFTSRDGEATAKRVDEQFQDTMGFTIVGRDHFLGSGHPAPGEDRPANLGLIESTNGGESWEEVSLAGEADFHVLRYAHERVYAVNALTGLLMLSDDGGESWTERRPPAGVIDLAVDPGDAERIVAATEGGLGLSEDDGRRWRRLPGEIGLVAWPEPNRLYLIDANGGVQVSESGGQKWSKIGEIGGQPAALAAESAERLYAALHDGTVVESTDGGTTWDVRSSP